MIWIRSLIVLVVSQTSWASTYSYDEINRLKSVVYDNGSIVSYAYDAAGNIIEKRTDTNPDPDSDTISSATDNCPFDANFDQADNDLDSQGDACDLDDDNDGLFDAEELELGSNPFLNDSDGDGYLDGTEVAFGSDPIGDQSTPETLVNITGSVQLLQGLNLIGTIENRFFVRSVADWIEKLGGESAVQSVAMLDPVSGQTLDCAYEFSVLVGPGCEQLLSPGVGWFVRMDEPRTIVVQAPVDCPVLQLTQGPNLVSFPCLEEGTTAFGFLNNYANSNDITTIETLDGDTARWGAAVSQDISSSSGNNFDIAPLKSYILHVRSSSTLYIER